VFLAYRDVFTGENAQMQTDKAIRNLVLQHWLSKKSLVGGYGEQKVVCIPKALLNKEVFALEAEARK